MDRTAANPRAGFRHGQGSLSRGGELAQFQASRFRQHFHTPSTAACWITLHIHPSLARFTFFGFAFLRTTGPLSTQSVSTRSAAHHPAWLLIETRCCYEDGCFRRWADNGIVFAPFSVQVPTRLAVIGRIGSW